MLPLTIVIGVSLVTQTIKNLPAMQKTHVRSLGWEDPLEKGMPTPTPVFLAGGSHGQRSLLGYSPWVRKESNMTERLSTHTHRNHHKQLIEN